MSILPTHSSDDTIPEQEAIDITTNYRNYISSFDPSPDFIKAFLIPMEDIIALASFHKCPNVRAYLSMAVPGDNSSMKLILVPVGPEGNDILNVPVTGETGDVVTQSSIYDFTSPCPQACDLHSPLFQ